MGNGEERTDRQERKSEEKDGLLSSVKLIGYFFYESVSSVSISV